MGTCKSAFQRQVMRARLKLGDSDCVRNGFTMVEILTVVAILVVLVALIFVGITRYQRSLYQLELDGTAKEIYITAQNHLTLAEGQGALAKAFDANRRGTKDESATTRAQNAAGAGSNVEVYYYIVRQGDPQLADTSSVLGLMLPFGSIDETVRTGGSYIIRYQFDPESKRAYVLDVFYTDPKAHNAGFRLPRNNGSFAQGDYDALFASDAHYTEMNNVGKDARANYGNTRAVVGYYNGEGASLSVAKLEAPTVKVENAERLRVWVTDSNLRGIDATNRLMLEVKGAESGAVLVIELVSNSSYTGVSADGDQRKFCVDLDDIAKSGGHFASWNGGRIGAQIQGAFIPGEDITIQAIADDVGRLSNIAKSSIVQVNSLFDSVEITPSKDQSGNVVTDDNGHVVVAERKVYVSNIRHLENLDPSISGFNVTAVNGTPVAILTSIDVEQTQNLAKATSSVTTTDENGVTTATTTVVEDLSWIGFQKKIANTPLSINGQSNSGAYDYESYRESVSNAIASQATAKIRLFKLSDSDTGFVEGSFIPINPKYALHYNGKQNMITDVSVIIPSASSSTPAGLFGMVPEISNLTSSFSNMKLVNFDITTANGNAGALAGTLASTTVQGVLAYNDVDDDSSYAITGSDNVGGLVGQMAGGSITESAAAVFVSATNIASGAAGGLVGKVAGLTISGENGDSILNAVVSKCYSGGHTVEGTGAYETDAMESMNVRTAGGSAGGLIGEAENTSIELCYSTCSTQAATAGGLVGKAAGSAGSITNCYATGKVKGLTSEATIAAQTVGALVGTCGVSMTNCRYYGIVNYDATTEDSEKREMPAVGSNSALKPNKNTAFAFDKDTATYKSFVTGSANAVSYDSYLESHYGGRYPLKNIIDLAGTTIPENGLEIPTHLFTHYGDWPAPETLVVNTRPVSAN